MLAVFLFGRGVMPGGVYLDVLLMRSSVASQVQGDVLVLYVYQLKTDASGVENVGVEKVSFRKQQVGAS